MNGSEQTPKPLAAALQQARETLGAGIEAKQRPFILIRQYTRAIDHIIIRLWQQSGPGRKCTLFATGGYGRRELFPGSDIDLAILLPSEATAHQRHAIERFIQQLWDIGLKPGHSVRTLPQTHDAARADAATFTSLLEARPLAGNRSLHGKLKAVLEAPDIWPMREYFRSKLTERRERYTRFDHTAYRLEPDLKEGPGGLRDLHTLLWVSARYLKRDEVGVETLIETGLLTPREGNQLRRAKAIYARLRLGLHHLAGRAENRLRFDLQPQLADLCGFEGRRGLLAVEDLMQNYYRAVRQVSVVGDILLGLLDEALHARQKPEQIEPHFIVQGQRLGLANARDLEHSPHLMLDLFKVWQRHPELHELTPNTLRTLLSHESHINRSFRSNPANRQRFLDILKAPDRVSRALRLMNRYGVLGRYLPTFGRIVGRMQYDLFHVYTVDEHILRVIANIRRLQLERFANELPNVAVIARRLDKPAIAYLAALFHDIAKGRGGNHSELGAQDALVFCRQHGLPEGDAHLVAWLVRNHLLLSLTAQKQDLSDPRVIARFAHKVLDQRRLDYLYVLTAADVRATNPDLWNNWRASLFATLYEGTSRLLWRGLLTPADDAADFAAKREQVATLFGTADKATETLWEELGDVYFRQYTVEEIVWHTRELLSSEGPPKVMIRETTDHSGTMISVYSTRDAFSFARVTAALEQAGLNIVEARCVPLGTDRTLDTYVVHDLESNSITEPAQLDRLQNKLEQEVARRGKAPRHVTRRPSRELRAFVTPTQINFTLDDPHQTIMELQAGDQPGLLTAVGQAFRDCGVYLRMAKIMTFGERAEDVFHLSDASGHSLDKSIRMRLVREITAHIARLEHRHAQPSAQN